MKPSLRILSLIALCVMLFGVGCERNAAVAFTSEESEPSFERGRQLSRQGRNQEALSAYLKVISKRGDEAPESHLEAGLIYRQHIKDPIKAIYHFSKYIELQPNSRQAELVRQQIAAATREFARTLPAHPEEDQSVKLGYQTQLDRLMRENDDLKSEIAALRAGITNSPTPSRSYSQGGFDLSSANKNPAEVQQPAPVNTSEGPIEEPVTGGETESPFVRAPMLEPTSTPSTEAPLFTKPLSPSNAAAAKPTASASVASTAKPTPPAAEKGRKHTVGPGDTLSNISQKYYGSRSRVKDIIAANKDLLRGGDRLSLGMELRIP